MPAFPFRPTPRACLPAYPRPFPLAPCLAASAPPPPLLPLLKTLRVQRPYPLPPPGDTPFPAGLPPSPSKKPSAFSRFAHPTLRAAFRFQQVRPYHHRTNLPFPAGLPPAALRATFSFQWPYPIPLSAKPSASRSLAPYRPPTLRFQRLCPGPSSAPFQRLCLIPLSRQPFASRSLALGPSSGKPSRSRSLAPCVASSPGPRPIRFPCWDGPPSSSPPFSPCLPSPRLPSSCLPSSCLHSPVSILRALRLWRIIKRYILAH